MKRRPRRPFGRDTHIRTFLSGCVCLDVNRRRHRCADANRKRMERHRRESSLSRPGGGRGARASEPPIPTASRVADERVPIGGDGSGRAADTIVCAEAWWLSAGVPGRPGRNALRDVLAIRATEPRRAARRSSATTRRLRTGSVQRSPRIRAQNSCQTNDAASVVFLTRTCWSRFVSANRPGRGCRADTNTSDPSRRSSAPTPGATTDVNSPPRYPAPPIGARRKVTR